MNSNDHLVFGAGGLGKEIMSLLKSNLVDCKVEQFGFLDDSLEPNYLVNNHQVFGGVNYLKSIDNQINIYIAIGNPDNKFKLFKRISDISNASINFPNLVAKSSTFLDVNSIELGIGNLITSNCILTTHIEIGNFNLINLNSTIGHDVQIGNYNSIMPGVHISGHTIIEDRVYIGTGANIINGVKIGEGAIIGAGTLVNKDIPPHETWAGVPAKRIQ